MKTKLSKIHFPTALGLFILLAAIGVGVYLVRTKTSGEIEAEASLTPEQVRITNVTDTGFSVSWTTDKTTTGVVKYGTETNALKNQALDDRDQLSGEAEAVDVHHVTLKNLQSSKKYFFKLDSGGKQFDNQGSPFEATTGPTLGTPPAADPVYGTILAPSGSPAEGVLVYVSLANAAPLSALAKTNGNWALSLSTARSADLASYLSYDTQATIVNILVQAGELGTAPAITTTSNDSPVPDITLGQSHDFRTAAASSAEADDSAESASGFSLTPVSTDSATATVSGEVTLENPTYEGEILNATQPAFIGTGPPGTVLSIEINSEDTYTGSITIDEEGDWEFTPPEGLESGEHMITITYIDTEGTEQSLTRNFTVAAAGESAEPAITATPSGEATDAGRTELPATDAGVPEPGTGEMTLLMLLTGLGLLIGGMRLKNRV
jgi:hypothetical protein